MALHTLERIQMIPRMNRRNLLKTTAAAATGILVLKPSTLFGYQANSAVRLGLLGCGNRGTSVATSFVHSTNTHVAAIGDLFPDRLERGKAHFNDLAQSMGQPPLDEHETYLGRHAIEKLAASTAIDMIQISTPPWFHVEHLGIAVASGKHIYCEKPVGIDVAQTRHALDIAKKVQPNQSVAVGFQCRNAPGIAAAADRIRSGALGKIVSIDAYYNAPASVEVVVPNASADEHRLRNWLWDRALSGDILVEQNIHVIDICNWILQSHPIKAIATGGRNIINHPGDCWDNYQVSFTYPDDVHLSFSSTQFCPGHWFDVSERVFGSKGIAEAPYSGPLRIIGDNAWTWSGSTTQPTGSFAANGSFSDNLAQADSEKDKGFIESITSGKFHNQIATGVETARSCMLGRMAGHLKREVTWDELLAHGEEYHLDIKMSQFT